MNTYADMTDAELADPFASLGVKYAKKPLLRDTNTPFDILGVEGPVDGQFGEELIISIEVVDPKTGELEQQKMSFPYLNKANVVGPRTTALLAIQAGINRGLTYRNYKLTGSGTGFLFTKAP